MTSHNFQLLSIRDIEEISEMRTVEELQKEVWGIDDREVFPALAMVPMREVGGVLIGAFDGDRMIGFVFGFPGCEHGRVILHSDMLAVRPEYRSRGVGYKLKLAQREKALAQGIDTITWTFDPLQALNAHLNISKLGVIGDSYRVNYYGQTTSFLHRTGTDRLWVTWLLQSERVKERLAGGSATGTPGPQAQGPQRRSAEGVEEGSPDESGVVGFALAEVPTLVRLGENEEPVGGDGEQWGPPFLVIEIPANINTLLKKDVERAVRWREATRQAFTRAMARSYVVAEFYRVTRNGQGVGVYLLSAKK